MDKYTHEEIEITLARLGDEEAVKSLRGRSDPRALYVLAVSRDPGAVAAYRKEAAEGIDPSSIVLALNSGSGVKDKNILSAAIARLKHPDPAVRRAAIHAIGELGTPSDAAYVARFVSDGDISLASSAAHALQSLDSNRWKDTEPKDIELGISMAKARRPVFSYRGQTYMKSLSLSAHFPEEFPQQDGGSCHIFAATALFGEACLRKTGREVFASEAYLFYRHLRSKFEQKTAYTKAEHDGRFQPTSYTSEDGGNVMDSFTRIFDGSVCDAALVPFNYDFIKSLKEPLKGISSATAEEEKSLSRKFCKSADGHMVTCLKEISILDADGGVRTRRPTEGPIAECLKRLDPPKKEEFSIEKALHLLNSGVPFLCEATFVFPGGAQGPHITTVTGYDYKTGISDTEWQVRDPNFEKLMRTKGTDKPCETIYYFP